MAATSDFHPLLAAAAAETSFHGNDFERPRQNCHFAEVAVGRQLLRRPDSRAQSCIACPGPIVALNRTKESIQVIHRPFMDDRSFSGLPCAVQWRRQDLVRGWA